MDPMGMYAFAFFISLIVLLGIFFLMREVMCWYWKVNVMVKLLQDIDSKLTPPPATNMKDLLNTLK